MPTNYEWLLHMDGDERQAWFDAEHVDAQRDNNETCPNGNETASNGEDSRGKLEADIYKNITISITPDKGDDGVLAPYQTVLEWLNRQAEITRKTEQAAWIQQANGLIHEANVRADELQATVDNLRAECDECVYKLEWRNMDRLEAERDALAADLQDCEKQRERLRQALGEAIDHAHEVVSLVTLDGEVIG